MAIEPRPGMNRHNSLAEMLGTLPNLPMSYSKYYGNFIRGNSLKGMYPKLPQNQIATEQSDLMKLMAQEGYV